MARGEIELRSRSFRTVGFQGEVAVGGLCLVFSELIVTVPTNREYGAIHGERDLVLVA